MRSASFGVPPLVTVLNNKSCFVFPTVGPFASIDAYCPSDKSEPVAINWIPTLESPFVLFCSNIGYCSPPAVWVMCNFCFGSDSFIPI